MPQDIVSDISSKIDGMTGSTSATPAAPPNGTPTKPAAAPAPKSAASEGPSPAPSLWDSAVGLMGANPGPAMRYATQFVKDAPGALWNGVTNAVNEATKTGEHLTDAAFDGADWVANKTGVGKDFTKWYTSEHQKAVAKAAGFPADIGPLIPKGLQAEEPKTGLGETLQSVTQLAAGIYGVGKFMKPLEGIEEAGGIAKVAFGATKAAIADLSVMDPYQNRLSEIMQQAPWIGPTIKQYLAADHNDSFAEAKLKQGLEGFMVGVPLEALIGATKVIKASRLFTTPGVAEGEAKFAVSEAGQSLDQAVNKVHSRYQVEPQEDGTFRIKDTAPVKAVTEATGAKVQDKAIEQALGNSAGDGELPPGIESTGNKLEDFIKTGVVPVKAGTQAAKAPAGRFTLKTVSDSEYEVLNAEGKSQGTFASRDAASAATDKLNKGIGVPTRSAVRPPETPAQQATAATARKTPTTSTMAGADANAPAEDLYHPKTFESQAQADAEAAILNTSDVEKTRMNPPGMPFTKAQLDAYKTTVGNIDSPEKFNELLGNGDGADFNFHVIHGEADAKIQLDTLAKVQREGLDAARGGESVSHAETIAIAKSMFPGEDAEAFVGRLTRVYKNTQDLAAHLLAGKSLMILQARRMHQLATMADGVPESPAAMARLVGGLEEFYHTVAATKSIQSNAARAVEIGKVDAATLLDGTTPAAVGGVDKGMTVLERQIAAQGADAVQARKALVAIHGMSYDELRMMTRRLAIAGGDPQGILGAVYSIPSMPKPLSIFGFKTPALQQGTEWLINSLISGVHTLSVVNTSMGLNYLIKPLEMMGAGAWRSLREGSVEAGSPLRQEGWQTLAATYKSVWDSIHLAAQSFKNGAPILDASDTFSGTPQYIGGDLGTLARLPSRLHMATNEFWQQMGYRANATAAALKEAGDNGVKDVEKFVNNRLDASFAGPNRTGRGLDKARLNYARELTYSQDLPQGSWPQSIQRMVAEHPSAKIIAPFTLKPANLMYWSWDRTPGVNMLHQSFRDDLFAGGDRGALAAAKMGTGLALWGAAGGLALAGKLTGKRPFNPALTNQANSMDLPPEYSLNLGTNEKPNWVSYKQAEPLAGPVKLGADFLGIVADVAQASGEMSVHPIKNIGVATATMLSNAFVSETYFTSIVNFMSAAGSSDPNAWDKFIRNEGAAMVPNVLNSFNPDPYVREIRSVVDAELAKTPGFSEQLPPRFNVLGEPVLKPPGIMNRMLPFVMSGKGNGALEAAMLRLGQAMPMPAENKDGVDLTSDQFGKTREGLTPYDRMMQLIGQPKNGNKNLRDDMTELLHDPSWSDLPDSATAKFTRAAHMVERHRSTAERQMLEEFPGLADFITQSKQGKNASKREGDDGIRRIMGLTQSPNQ